MTDELYAPQSPRSAVTTTCATLRISGRGVWGGLGGAFGVVSLDLLEQFFDARLVRDGLVELEGELGHASQIESHGQRAPDEGQRAIERARGLLPFGRIAQGGVVNARLLEVRRDGHARQREKTDARIAHVTGEDVADFLPDLLGELDGA